MAPTLLLDLDGTLVDSVPDLLASVNRVMAARGFAPFTAPQVTAMVGDGAPALVGKVMAARGRMADTADLDEFLADYTVHSAVATRAFPGVPETLRTLAGQGWRLAVCTNKPMVPTRALLASLGLLDVFAAIGAGDSYPSRKPDPAHLLATLAEAGGARDAAVMVGDHHNDVQAAAGAGLPCIFAAWGYGPPAMAAGAQATAGSFAEAAAIAARLLRLGVA